MKVLILCSSRFGHTQKIAEEVANVLRKEKIDVEIRPAHVVREFPKFTDGIILAGSVRYGFYSPTMRKFSKKYAEKLNKIPSAFIGVSLSSEKPEKSRVDNNRYAKKFFKNNPWKPDLAKLFTGEVNFDLYRGIDRIMLNKILEISGKPHGDGVKIDYTDWAEVRTFAIDYAALMNRKQASGRKSECKTDNTPAE